MLRFRRFNLIIAFILFFIGMVENLVILMVPFSYNQSSIFFTCASFINLILLLYGLERCRSKFLSLAELFICFSYLFNFGQVYNKVLFPTYRGSLINAIKMEVEDFNSVFLFTLNILLIISIFTLIVSRNVTVNSCCYDKARKYYIVRKIGFLVLFLTLPFELYYLYILYSYARFSSYTGFSTISINSYIIQIGTFSLIGFSLILCSYCRDKIKGTFAYCFGVFFYFLTMLTGSRIYGVASICVLSYLYCNLVIKINVFKLVPLIIFCVIFLGVINSIMHVRQMGSMSFNAVLVYMLNNRHNNLLAAIFEEFGGSVYTTRIAMQEIPKNINYNMGQSYLRSILWIFPNIGGFISNQISNVEFTLLFQTKYSYGGNYIAELYYNFGDMAYFFAVPIGMIIGTISSKIDNLIESHNFKSFSFYVMGMYSTLIWVRSYFDIFPRNIVWACVFMIFLLKLIRDRKS